MNERIKELARKSGLLIEIDDTGCCFAGEPENHSQVQKFAELIVRDCEQALRPQLRDMISRGQAYELIKRHFGVEQ